MQRNSIHNPVHRENAQTKTPFPTFGNNFRTVACLEDVTDPMALLEAVDFLEDCTIALEAFEQERKRTCTP